MNKILKDKESLARRYIIEIFSINYDNFKSFLQFSKDRLLEIVQMFSFIEITTQNKFINEKSDILIILKGYLIIFYLLIYKY